MSNSVGDIFFDLKLDKTEFNRGLNEVEGQASKIGSSIGRKVSAGLTLAGLGKFAKDCLYAGSKLNAMRSMAGVAFPTMTKQVQTFAQNAAGSFGLSEKMALQYVGTLGAMANGFGFTEKQAMTLSTTLAALSGDVASFYSMSQDEAFNKLQAVFTGETEGLKQLGIVMTQTALDQFALEQGMGRTTAQMSEQEKVLLRYNFVLSQLKLAQGDFVRTQSAWGNQVKILQMNFSALQAQLGQGLIAVLKPAIQALNIFMGKLIQVASVFNAFMSKVFGATKKKPAVSQSLYNIGDAGGVASGGLGGVSNAAGSAAKATKKAAKAMKKAQRDLMGFDKMNKLAKKNKDTGTNAGGGGGGAGGGVGGVGAGDIAGLNDGLFDTQKKSIKLGKIWQALAEVGKALIRLFKALKPVAKIIWDVLVKPFLKLIGLAVTALLEALAGDINLLASAIEKHPKLFAGLIIGLGVFVGVIKLFNKVINPMRVAIKNAGGAFKWLGKFITPKGLIIGGIIALALAIGYVYQNWDKIKKTKFGKVLIAIGKQLQKVGKAISKEFEGLKPYISEFVKALKSLWAVVKKLLISAFKGLQKALKPMMPVLKRLAKILVGIFINKLKFLVKILGLVFKIIFKVGTFIANTLTKAFKGVNKVVEKFTDGLEKIKGGAKFDIKFPTWDDLKDKWNEITSNIKGKTVEFKADVATKWADLKDKWNNLKNNFKGKTESIRLKIGSKWSDLRDKWNKLKSKFKGKIVTIGVSIKAIVAKAYNAVARKVNAAKRAHPIILKAIPTLPYLAQGGYAQRNTPQLAVVGDNKREGEIVSPESKLQKMADQAARNAGDNTQIISLLKALLTAVQGIDTNVYLDGNRIAQNTVRYINNETRRTGATPILL